MKKAIGLGIAALVIIIILTISIIAISSGSGSFFGTGEKASCDGEVEVDFLGIGNPDLDPAPQCFVTTCRKAFSLVGGIFDALLPGDESGNVIMFVNGKQTDNLNWESNVGENIAFTMESGCEESIDNVYFELYNSDGARVATEVVIE